MFVASALILAITLLGVQGQNCDADTCSARYVYMKRRTVGLWYPPFFRYEYYDTQHRWCVEVSRNQGFPIEVGSMEIFDNDLIRYDGARTTKRCTERTDITDGGCVVDDGHNDNVLTHRCTNCALNHHTNEATCESSGQCVWQPDFQGCYGAKSCHLFSSTSSTYCNGFNPGVCAWKDNTCKRTCNSYHFNEAGCNSDHSCKWYAPFLGCYDESACGVFTASGASVCNAFNPGVCVWRNSQCENV